MLVNLGVVDGIAFGIGGVDGEGNGGAALRVFFQHHAHGVGIQTGFGLGGVEQGVNPAVGSLSFFKSALGIEAGSEPAYLFLQPGLAIRWDTDFPLGMNRRRTRERNSIGLAGGAVIATIVALIQIEAGGELSVGQSGGKQGKRGQEEAGEARHVFR